ncbi:MAG: hypothetical protein HY709_09645 [Candidatus Latescibacteria bacterium]|nr:hypothetical protein [Candidatus Latescibacterota bacterium]
MPDFEAVISTLVLMEIRGTSDAEKRAKLEELVVGMDVLEFDEEADRLAQGYVGRGVSKKTLV